MNFREQPEISVKLEEIVDLVFRFRFITRRQLQTLIEHKDPSRLNKWLKELVEKGYLGRIYSTKLLENTKPAIYYLGNNGIIRARWGGMESLGFEDFVDLKYLKKYYQDRLASQNFIDHSTTIFDIYLQFKGIEKADKNKDREYFFETKSEIWTYEKIHQTGEVEFRDIQDLIPDAHFEKSLVTQDKIEESSWYIILFDPHVPRYAIRYKIDKYIEAYEESDGKQIKGLAYKFPTLLLIFPTCQKANQIDKYIKRRISDAYIGGMLIYTSTIQTVMDEGLGAGEKTWKVIAAGDNEEY